MPYRSIDRRGQYEKQFSDMGGDLEKILAVRAALGETVKCDTLPIGWEGAFETKDNYLPPQQKPDGDRH